MPRKKIITILIKILIGAGSFYLVYTRLKSDFTPDKTRLLYDAVLSPQGLLCLFLAILLIPVNWGIETVKWMILTRPVEEVSFRIASKSVYSGVCLGNLAPGRATEFVAKVLFFQPEHRPQVSVLHFVGGMFQLSITVVAGMVALLYEFRSFGETYSWMPWVAGVVGASLLVLLALFVWRIDEVLHFIVRKFSHNQDPGNFHYTFSNATIVRLFAYSAARYAVFFTQFVLLLWLCQRFTFTYAIFAEVALYFLITTTIPMISVIEAAIRAAIALVVFHDSGIGNTALALSSFLIWMVNIIIPSIAGYIFLLQQNFNFRFLSLKK